MTNLQIGFMNVRGLADKKKRADVFAWLRNKHCDIICLADIHSNQLTENNFKEDWGYDCYINSFTSSSRGTAVLIRGKLPISVLEIDKDTNGNLLILVIRYSDITMTLVVVYGPNEDSPEFYLNLLDKLKTKDQGPLILCGDWNLVLNFKLDTFGYIRENNVKAREKVKELMDSFNLIDGWRSNNESAEKYTWFSSKSPIKMARLDFFLLSPDMFARSVDFNMSFGYRTDHSFITAKISIHNSQHGKGFWKLNTSLLYDKDYVTLIKDTIKDTLKTYARHDSEPDENSLLTISHQMFLEMLKLNIRGNTISFASYKSKSSKMRQNNLEKTIETLNVQICNTSNLERKEEILNEIDALQKELQQLREPKIRASMARARVQSYEEGEKPSKYFCNLEKRNAVNKIISCLDIKGEMVTDHKKILAAQQSYYQNLYTKCPHLEDSQTKKILNTSNVRKLNDTQKEKCEGPILEEEVKVAIKFMKNNKTPGTDGLPCEFYKIFWNDLKVFLLKSYNEAFENVKLSISQTQGIITCLPKGQKPRQHLQNWRPITLLNVDYKILSTIIANRLKKVLPEIISDSQKGFLKGIYWRKYSDHL